MSAEDDLAVSSGTDEIRMDAISALTALGYREKDAEKVIGKLTEQADDSQPLSSELLIRQALQSMSGGSR